MAILYPTSLDSLTNPTSSNTLNSPPHATQHADANDAIEALEAKVGVDSSAVTTSHDYKLGEVTGSDKAVGKTATQTLTNKTLTTPTIGDFTNAGHTHANAANGGQLTDAALSSAVSASKGGTGQSSLTANNVILGNGTSAVQFVAPGSSGNVLTSNGTTWVSGAASPNSDTFTADQDLTAGQPVGMSNYTPSDRIALANRIAPTATLGFTNELTYQQNNTQCPIGGDKFVFIGSQGSDDSLYATVASVAPTTKIITLGTSLAATADSANSVATMAVCKLDTDKFIIFYREDASTTVIKYRVGTVSGTTITYGTAATAFTGGTAVNLLVCDFISTDKCIAIFKCATATDTRAVCFTVSETVATGGTAVAVSTNTDDATATIVRKIGTDKFAHFTTPDGSNGYLEIGTLSGTTITLGTAVTFTTTMGNSAPEMEIISPTTDVVVMTWRNNSTNFSDMIAATISGTTPTFGSILAGVTTATGNSGLFSESTTSTLLYSSGITGGGIKQITRSGTTLTNAGIVIQLTGGRDRIVTLDNGYYVMLSSSSTTLTYYIQGMSNNYIGIVQSTVSRGATVTVKLRGAVDANQSGLIQGGLYQVSTAGAFTFISSGTTGLDTMQELSLGVAASATELIMI